MKAIVAIDQIGAIGINNMMPWPHSKIDMKNFFDYTKGHAVVMGSATWESLPIVNGEKLPGRKCYVLSKRDADDIPGYPHKIIRRTDDAPKDAIVIGGSKTYEAFGDRITEMRITIFKSIYQADTMMPEDLFKRIIATLEDQVTEIYSDDDLVIVDIRL